MVSQYAWQTHGHICVILLLENNRKTLCYGSTTPNNIMVLGFAHKSLEIQNVPSPI